jgi:hypothetical protein
MLTAVLIAAIALPVSALLSTLFVTANRGSKMQAERALVRKDVVSATLGSMPTAPVAVAYIPPRWAKRASVTASVATDEGFVEATR